MEEPAPDSPSAEKRSLKTAEALRALREGLGAKLETHRRRISDIESDLSTRVLQIAEELAQEQAAESQAALALHEDQMAKLRESLTERDARIAKLERQISDADLSHLRLSAELTEARSAIEAIRSQQCQHCATLRTELALASEQVLVANSQLQDMQAQILQLTQEVAHSQVSAAALLAEQSNGDSLLVETQNAFEQTQKLLDETIAELEASEEREVLATSRVEDLLIQIDQLAEELIESQNTQESWLTQQAAEDEALAESQAALATSQQLLKEKTAELAALEKSEAAAAAHIEKLLAEVTELNAELSLSQEAQAKLQAQQSAGDNVLAASQAAAERDNQRLRAELVDATDTQNRLTEDLAQAQAEITVQQESKLAADRDNQQLRAQMEEAVSARDLLAEELTQVRAEITAQEESSVSELSWLEKEFEAAEQGRKQLATEFEQLLKQHKTTEEILEASQLKNEQAVALLQKAEEKIIALSDTKAHDEELEQAQRKFELALADTQKLKRENAALQEDLAQRPEKSDAESPELVSLRVERDALASRVAELEATPAQVVDQDAEQRLSDLQRRFELAVEDLRHLKQENSTLQEKLTRVPEGGHASHGHSTAMDWQSQKARLLAALESEDAEEETSERCQERTTIEGTISITDRVVADKDREIAELRAELADRSFAVVEESSAAESDMLGKDELIVAERAKLAELQKELHEKLRTAEMEMSLQRATLARKEAEIEHKQQAAQQAAADAPVGPDGKPRRKWLSALGLRDDDEK